MPLWFLVVVMGIASLMGLFVMFFYFFETKGESSKEQAIQSGVQLCILIALIGIFALQLIQTLPF